MRIFFLTTTSGRAIAEAVSELKKNGIDIEINIFYPFEIAEERISEEKLSKIIDESNVILIDIRGGGKVEDILIKYLQEKDKIIVVFLGTPKLMSLTRLGSFSLKKFPKGENITDSIRSPESVWNRIKRVQKIIELTGKIVPLKTFKDAKNYVTLLKYWGNASKENYYNMFLLLGKYLNRRVPKNKKPIEFYEYGIYHPEFGNFQKLEDYLKKSNYDKNKSTIGILFFGGVHFQQNLLVIKKLTDEFKEYNLIPVYSNGIYNLKAIKEFFFLKDKPIVSAVISLLWFRLNGGPFGGDANLTLELLKKLNVPVFCPSPMFLREIEKWEESNLGLSQIEIITSVVWPELDGTIEPIPSCGLKDIEIDGIKCKEVVPIEERIERIKKRIENWIKLKNKENRDKRIAIIIYDYPPGEANIGSAAYLDVFKSLEEILKELKKEGYKVELPEKQFDELFEEYYLVNSGKWMDIRKTAEKCFLIEKEIWQKFFNELDEDLKEEIRNFWGPPPGNIMTYQEKILIPAIEFGNILIGLQPARPQLSNEDVKKAAHDKTKPPHYQYIAFYRWIEKIWKADAIIHLGTHGLAEFTKGKEVGMSRKCFPDILIGNLPHLYVYHVLNTSESTIAKRRLYGTMIDYNSPPYTSSDLYEDYLVLEDLIHEYNEAKINDRIRAEIVKENILKKAKELDFEINDIDLIHNQLYKMKRSIIPKGLHILGEKYSKEDLIEFLVLLLRYDRDGIKSLNRILSEAKGYDYERIIRENDVKYLKEIEDEAKDLIVNCVKYGISNTIKKARFNKKIKEELIKTIEYGLNISKTYADNRNEIKSIIRGLNFEFIEPAIGGDVIRTPEALPTGRNLYQFDPSKIPTESAMIRGKEIAENTLKFYYEKNKKYPESIGVILWGFETTQTQGETVAQILNYLGVKIIRKYSSWYPEIEVIPLNELNRPRIDCLINICGFFREMFPNIMQLLDRAFNIVSNLDEPEELNFIKKHSRENYEEIKDKFDEKTAIKISNARIFGPTSSEYGTRMLPLVEDSVWEKEEDLAEVYINSMSHLHAENIHAESAVEIYKKNLSYVELVSQIRSSQDYEIVDLDHYFEFFGGLSKSVETVKGKKPEMLISDTTKEIIETEDIEEVIKNGVKTRILNPKWIDELLKHNFHGAKKIAERVENILGLSATTGKVSSKIWYDIAKRYIFDKNIREKLTKNNKWATMEIIERLFEANKRGYWNATEDELKELKNAYLEIENLIEDKI
jgi:cobaltochelatase CobN